jgi:hypothetical protein
MRSSFDGAAPDSPVPPNRPARRAHRLSIEVPGHSRTRHLVKISLRKTRGFFGPRRRRRKRLLAGRDSGGFYGWVAVSDSDNASE